MSQRFQGIGVSPGVAYAPAMVVDLRFPDVPDRSVSTDAIETEVARLHAAVDEVVLSLTELRRRVEDRAGPEEAGIFEAQMLMARDPEFLGSVELLIRANLLSAETAFEFKSLEMQVAWSGASNLRLRERLADLTAVQLRMLRVLTGKPAETPGGEPGEPVVIVAHELSPGLTVQFARDSIAALVAEEGTRTSHAAILAHSLGIPAVMGVPGNIIGRLESGTILLVDGSLGSIVVDPSPDELREASTQLTRRRKFELELEAEVDLPCVTPDGEGIELLANVDLPEELAAAVRHGAHGVGLLRTEFLATGRTQLPTEEEQVHYFRRVATGFPKGVVTIRTFDLGGDKFPIAFQAPEETNPFLGWRSIRVCLDQEQIFRPQLRALLRASVMGNIRVMLPLVTRVDEVQRTREIITEEAAALAAAGIPATASLQLGVMIETPAAVILADRLARVSDFFSVGTNDLTQYTMAVDRGNARLASRFTPHDPALIRQLRHVVEVASSTGIPCGVCGEMASEPLMAILLVGLGYKSLSVAPPTLLLIKWLLRRVPMAVSRDVARQALDADGPDAVLAMLREAVQPYVDPRVLDTHGTLPGKGPQA